MVYRTALFSMTLTDPKPRFHSYKLTYKFISSAILPHVATFHDSCTKKLKFLLCYCLYVHLCSTISANGKISDWNSDSAACSVLKRLHVHVLGWSVILQCSNMAHVGTVYCIHLNKGSDSGGLVNENWHSCGAPDLKWPMRLVLTYDLQTTAIYFQTAFW